MPSCRWAPASRARTPRAATCRRAGANRHASASEHTASRPAAASLRPTTPISGVENTAVGALVRARLYRYRFTTPAERRQTGAWWSRDLVGDYLPPLRLDRLGGAPGRRPGRTR